MKTTVKALPVEDIIDDLSESWEVPVDRESGELTIQVPEKLGKGFVRGTSFQSGIGIIEYKCNFHQDHQIEFTINRTHPLKFVFCSEGKIAHTFAEDDDTHTVDIFQNVIVSSSGNNGHVLKFTANIDTHVTSIEIVRDVFNKRKNYGYKELNSRLKEVFEDSVAEKKFFYQGNYSIKAADIVEEINIKKFNHFLRSIFLEGKLLEMLSLQIEQYQDDQNAEKLPQILRRSDVDKVQKASKIINDNLNKNFTVDYLAKEVGTNVNKLQEGFKHLHNLTVNKYMQQVKLEAAKEMLSSSEHNISQVVSLIGLNNRSYFSKIFKEKYGVSPRHFLNSPKNDDSEEEEENGEVE